MAVATNLVPSEAGSSWGMVAYVQSVGNISFTTETTILTLSYVSPGNRRYCIRTKAEIYSSAANNVITMKITDNSNTKLERAPIPMKVANTAYDCQMVYYETPSAGTITRKLRGVRTTGAGTCNAGDGEIAFIAVYDMGPA